MFQCVAWIFYSTLYSILFYSYSISLQPEVGKFFRHTEKLSFIRHSEYETSESDQKALVWKNGSGGGAPNSAIFVEIRVGCI